MAQPAVTSATAPLRPVKAEPDRHPEPSLQLITTAIKQETALTTINLQSSEHLPSPSSQEPQPSPPVPHFLNSIKELRDLSDVLSAFRRCYDDLETHMDFIKSEIESRLPLQLANVSHPSLSEKNVNDETPTAAILFQPNETPVVPSEDNKQVKEKSTEGEQSEVEHFCATMCGRSLRKYMLSNLGESNRLREEVPKALRLAPDPAKLVLECSGRFFLQGSKAYTPGSHMIPAREASVLVLECFLLMGGEDGVGTEVRVEKAIKQESEHAAVQWRKRLISEGGLAKASEIDARGLLYFLGCFGVPRVFRHDDLRDLTRAGNVKEISGTLKRSRLLMAKIQDAIEGMVKNKMTIDAVDLAYSFGLEDKFTTHTMLTSFLRNSKESWKKTKRESRGSLIALNEGNKKHLAALRSVVRCLERHNLDPSKILSGWQISSKMLRLEREISDIDKNIRERTAKRRKTDDTEYAKKLKIEGTQYSYYPSNGLQLAAAPVDSHRNLLDGIPGHSSSSLASQSLLHGSGSGLLPENISGSVTGVSVGGSGLLPTDSYPGVHGAIRQANYTSQPYGLHGDAAYHEQLVPYAGQASSLGLNSLYRPSPSLEVLPSSSIGVSLRSSASDLYHFADNVDSESYYSRASNRVGVVPSSSSRLH